MSAEKGVQLLIVEDDPALQKQIKWSLDQFESVTADDRESALVQLRRHAPAVVTMDLGLPPNADDSTEGFLLLEQIVSHGKASPEGFWYDQPRPEWVMLLRGTARLQFADGERPLAAGDALLIPAHCRHRVAECSLDAIWLALHFQP